MRKIVDCFENIAARGVTSLDDDNNLRVFFGTRRPLGLNKRRLRFLSFEN